MMKHIFLTIIPALFFSFSLFGQYTTVNYDLGRNWFNEGQLLPAEEAMIVKGDLPPGMDMVELHILSEKGNKVLYTAMGQHQPNNSFSVLVPYLLRSNELYDFRLDFFQQIPPAKKEALAAQLIATLNTYIDMNTTGQKRIKLLRNAKKAVREMNELSADILSNYRPSIAGWEPAFSELVQLKMEQLEAVKLDAGYSKKDTTTTITEVRSNQREELVQSLKDQVEREVRQWLNTDLSLLTQSQLVDDYRTERKENTLSLNAGYGGVYLDGGTDDLTYGASPYLGLSFPLGKVAFGSKLLGNTSLTMGAFTSNFEDAEGREITGFLVNRPIYLGLDHKLFKFVRINAGAAFMEKEGLRGGNSSSDLLVRPFVGLSARIDLSIKLGD